MNKVILNKIFLLPFILSIFISTYAQAESSTLYQLTADKPISEVYENMQKSMDESRFFVVKEINIGKNISSFAEKWGDDYNKNKLTAIRSMVFCNGWYANKISNLDPSMLGACPLHLTLIEKDGKTTTLFNRPTVIAKGSPAYNLFVEIENEVIEIIKKGMK